MPRDTNAGGSIFGGWTLSQMDLAGGTLAGERAAGRVATVSIDAMRFLRPVSVGDEVSCYCVIEKAGDTSIAVKIETSMSGRMLAASTFAQLGEVGVKRLFLAVASNTDR